MWARARVFEIRANAYAGNASGAADIAEALALNDSLISIFVQVAIAADMTLMLQRVYARELRLPQRRGGRAGVGVFHIAWPYRFGLFEIALLSL